MTVLLLWLYRGILRVLAPRDLRAEFGEEIEHVFEELLREARTVGPHEVLRVWAREVRQLSGEARRLAKPAGPSHPGRRSGRAGRGRGPWAVLGGIVFHTQRCLATLAHRPSYALASILTLGVGLGLTGAVYGVARVSVLGEIPTESPDRVVVVRGWLETAEWQGQTAMSAMELMHVADHVTAFSDFALFSLRGDATLTGVGHADRLRVGFVSLSYFDVFRAEPALGRFFSGDDTHRSKVPQVVLAHHTWSSRFGADPHIVGRTVTLSGRPFQVVGVTDARHRGVGRIARGIDAWLPIGFAGDFMGTHVLESPKSAVFWGVGRLADGVPREVGTGEVERLHEAFAAGHDLGDRRQTGFLGLREYFFGGVQRPFVAVAVGALLVLLVCTLNLVALARLRARDRSDELRLKAALGASRLQLAGATAGETLVLAGVGTLAAVGIARLGLSVFDARWGRRLVTFAPVELDLGLLFVTAAVAAALFAVPSVMEGLRSGPDGIARFHAGITSARVPNLIVTLETALAVLVLVPALLTGISLAQLRGVELGYQPAGLESVRVNLVGTEYGDYRGPGRFAREVQGRLTAISNASVGMMGPDMMGQSVTHVEMVAAGADRTKPESVVKLQWISVTPGTLGTLGIERIAGRDISWEDQPGSSMAVVLNERGARRLWPGESPIGKAVHVAGAARPNGVIVGLVKDARHIGRAGKPYVAGDGYFALAQRPTPKVTVLYRSGTEPPITPATVREAIAAVDGGAATYDPMPVASVLLDEESPIRLILALTTAYALIAMLLAVIGMASILGTAVRERRRELAVRAALGASAPVLVWHLARGVAAAALLGLGVGTGLAVVSVPALSPVLFRVSATDPAVYLEALASISTLALVAISLPSLQALRIPPAESIGEA